MLSVVILIVIMLSVMAPTSHPPWHRLRVCVCVCVSGLRGKILF
jgi:hypothetical protein